MKTKIIFLIAGMALSNAIKAEQPSYNVDNSTDASFHERCDTNLVTDIDGNTYKTVRIGTQTWMAENLKTTKYNDGTAIPLIKDNASWASLSTPAYCWFNNDEATYKDSYGALYNWYAVNTAMLCPAGWHVPNDNDWKVLFDDLGGSSVAGGKMKEVGTAHWLPPNTGATNESGFSGLPGSWRDPSASSFFPIGSFGHWWSSSEYSIARGSFYTLAHERSDIGQDGMFKEGGFSVRCVQHPNTVPSITTNVVVSITDTSATGGGNRCFDGDSTVSDCGICWSTSPNPDISNSKTIDGIGIYGFTSSITGLNPNTTYYVRAYAINSNGIGYGNELLFKTMNGTILDIEGNVYKKVTIGSQTWMAENLRTTMYNDNTPIANITDDSIWHNSTSGAYCWFNNNIEYKEAYGALYNWFTVNTNKLCPSGWHVPDDLEWNTLGDYLGDESIAGGKLLESGAAHWQINQYGTNESGFTALPGGYRSTSFYDLSIGGSWWSKTQDDEINAWNRGVGCANAGLFRYSYDKSTGFGIRCLKDAEDSTQQVDLQKGLIAYYPFNGNANDESGNKQHGVVNGASLTTNMTGNAESAYYFNGINNYIEVPNNPLINFGKSVSFTIALWLNSTERGTYALVDKGINDSIIYGMELISGTPRFSFGQDNSAAVLYNLTIPETDSSWHFIIATADRSSNTLRLYIDGDITTELILESIKNFVMSSSATLKIGIDRSFVYPYKGKLDEIRIYNRVLNYKEIQALYRENSIEIHTPEINTKKDDVFEIPVNADNIQTFNNAISYQFDFNFNAEKIQYQSYSIEGTLSSDGYIQVNPSGNKLSVAWASQTPLADSGTLLKLQFRALETGTTTPDISNCLVNTDTVRNIENGTITINPALGDVDISGSVQAYDAALALQYSVGLDPLPDIDPLPWEDWRIATADVDGNDTVSAWDASLILKYVVGLIASFNEQAYTKSNQTPQSAVAVSSMDGYIIFRATREVFGLNVSITDGTKFLGEPQILYSGMLSAINVTSGKYSIGLATAYPPADNDIIMKIPVNNMADQQIIIDMMVNTTESHSALNLATGIAEPSDNSIEIYPNPANTILYFKNLLGEASFSIYDLQGRKIITGTITNNQVDIGNLDNGLYTIRIEDSKNTKIGKLIKQ